MILTRILALLTLLLALSCAALWVAWGWAKDDAAEGAAAVARLESTLASEVTARKAADKATAALAARKDRIHTVTKELIREIPTLIPADACALPGGWRLLHDSAASGAPAAPASGPAAAPVGPADAAGTVIDNYAACREQDAAYQELQRWLTEVTK